MYRAVMVIKTEQELGTVGLSRTQKQILDKFNVSRDLQDWLAQEFNEHGEPRFAEAPDFLMAISDHLQAAETYLNSQRIKLNQIQNLDQNTKTSQEEWQSLLNAYEEVVKEAWLRATGYWRIADEIISKPEEYGVKLQRKHIDYAFQKKNLPLVEMLKWTKPEFFFIPTPPLIQRVWAGFWAALGGVFSGMWGGWVWAKRITSRRKFWMRPFLFIVYSVRGILTGMMVGCIKAARLSYQIAKIKPGIQIGYFSAVYNPFVESMGSKQKQSIDIKIEEILFRLSERAEKKGLNQQSLQDALDRADIGKKNESDRYRAVSEQKSQDSDKTPDVDVRFAKEEDIGWILNLIKFYAAEHKILSEVLATEESLKKSLFGENKKAEVVLGFCEDKPVGVMIFFHHFNSVLSSSSLFIETFYILKSHRNVGLIEKMLTFLADLALKDDCQCMEWLVSNQNIILRELLQKYESKPMKDWMIYRIEGRGIRELAG